MRLMRPVKFTGKALHGDGKNHPCQLLHIIRVKFKHSLSFRFVDSDRFRCGAESDTEKSVEVCDVLKATGEGYFRNIVVGVLEFLFGPVKAHIVYVFGQCHAGLPAHKGAER